MKKLLLMTLMLCLLLAGCGNLSQDATAGNEQSATISPRPNATMENLTDATLAVSFAEGDVYVDDTGKLQMKVKIYTYDLYDAVDIAQLKVGDTIIHLADEVKVTSIERSQSGLIFVNGGLENGGFDLIAGDGGVFYECGFNDAKNWYEAGAETIRVSADFMGYDNKNPEVGEVIIYPGDFLIAGVVEYDFTPYNTTIRTEAGQIVELIRSFVP